MCPEQADAMKYLAMSIGAGITFALAMTAAAQPLSKDIAARIEAIPIQTLTISDEQFLKGDAYGKPTTIAGVLRVAQGSGRLPLVILVAGSGGFAPNADVWDRQFQEMGISTFAVDSFAGRGIVSTVVDQSQLGRLNMILDVYRSLAVLAAHPRVDPTRIAVMGFSRGGQAALYSSLKRFQRIWNPGGIEPATYIALYPPCITTFVGDTPRLAIIRFGCSTAYRMITSKSAPVATIWLGSRRTPKMSRWWNFRIPGTRSII